MHRKKDTTRLSDYPPCFSRPCGIATPPCAQGGVPRLRGGVGKYLDKTCANGLSVNPHPCPGRVKRVMPVDNAKPSYCRNNQKCNLCSSKDVDYYFLFSIFKKNGEGHENGSLQNSKA
jgi:hypothetical protein